MFCHQHKTKKLFTFTKFKVKLVSETVSKNPDLKLYTGVSYRKMLNRTFTHVMVEALYSHCLPINFNFLLKNDNLNWNI